MVNRFTTGLLSLIALAASAIMPYDADAISPELRKQLKREEVKMEQGVYNTDTDALYVQEIQELIEDMDDNVFLREYVPTLTPTTIDPNVSTALFDKVFTLEERGLAEDIAELLKDHYATMPADSLSVLTLDDISYGLRDSRVQLKTICNVDVEVVDTVRAMVNPNETDMAMRNNDWMVLYPMPDYQNEDWFHILSFSEEEHGSVVYVKGIPQTANFFSTLETQLPENPSLEDHLLFRYMLSDVDPFNNSGDIIRPRGEADGVRFDFTFAAYGGSANFSFVVKPKDADKTPTANYYIFPEMQDYLADYTNIETSPEEVLALGNSLPGYDQSIADFFTNALGVISQESAIVQDPISQDGVYVSESDPNLYIHREDSVAERQE